MTCCAVESGAKKQALVIIKAALGAPKRRQVMQPLGGLKFAKKQNPRDNLSISEVNDVDLEKSR
jgi:hypothetical protein